MRSTAIFTDYSRKEREKMSKMMGPGQKPGGNPDMKRRGSRNPGKTLKRLLGYIWKYYKMEFVIVLIAIVISSLAGVY